MNGVEFNLDDLIFLFLFLLNLIAAIFVKYYIEIHFLKRPFLGYNLVQRSAIEQNFYRVYIKVCLKLECFY